MSVPLWSLLIGILLVTMTLTGSLFARLPLNAAMIYLGLGYAIGPGGLGLITPDPIQQASALERISEFALLLSLFGVGLKLGIPMLDRRWIQSIWLAFPVMGITVGLVALVGVWFMDLSLGAAILLGSILAPTDPVLASGIRSEPGTHPDPARFSLAGEGALNDGTAFPFVLLGLGLLGLHDLGANGRHWYTIDLLWATIAGLVIGALLGSVIGRFVIYLRTRHQSAVGLDEFLSLGLIAISYGSAQLCAASGFLAVFAAGLALQRVREQPLPGTLPIGVTPNIDIRGHADLAIHSHHASATMTQAVQGFNEQLEKLAELGVVLVIGAMLPHAMGSQHFWFIPALLVILRPVAVLIGMAVIPGDWHQRAMIAWFGIRGIGSVFYLTFAIHHGVSGPLAQELVSLTLQTVAASIVVHGISVLPLMKWYARHKLSAE